MNILFLDQFSDLEDAQRSLLDVLPAVRERGWRAHVAAPGDGPLFESARATGATADRLQGGPYSRGRKSLAEFVRLAVDQPGLVRHIAALIERYKIDLVYLNGPRLALAAVWAAGRRTPVVFHCHSYLRRPYAAGIVGRSLAWARATVIASSSYVARPLARYVRPSSVHVVYNGVAGCPAVERTEQTPEEWRIGTLGRVAPENRQTDFLRAARLLHRVVPNCRFLICGDPLPGVPGAGAYYRQVRRLAGELRVELVGWPDDVCSVLSSLDLLVVASSSAHATPRVVPQALSAGVPLIAARAGALPELVSDGGTGFLADPNPNALAWRVQSVLTYAPDRLRELSENGRRVWRERFTLEGYRQRIVELMERAVGEA